ncbi:MAG: multiheme c-type cytochrome [bacterium]|nr:multiheme c-type cytochrome [bacterium]
MIHLKYILVSVFLSTALTQSVCALEPLPPEENAAFLNSVHEIIGCESCHLTDTPDHIPRKEIPQICGDCHPNPIKDYQQSVHWNTSPPAAVCTDCHGSHNITLVRRPDSKAYRSLVCGTCHIGPKEQFDRGPHREAMEKTGALACASCHSNHNVQRPTIAQIEPACLQCHTQNSPAFQMGQHVENLFTNVRDTLALASGHLAHADSLGMNTRRPEETLHEARAGFTRARLVWHSLNTTEIETETHAAASLAQQASENASDLLSSHHLRRLGLVLAWAVILANILLLYLKKRRLEKPQN